MPFFHQASGVNIHGGDFKDVAGDHHIYNGSIHNQNSGNTTNTTTTNSHNDSSVRTGHTWTDNSTRRAHTNSHNDNSRRERIHSDNYNGPVDQGDKYNGPINNSAVGGRGNSNVLHNSGTPDPSGEKLSAREIELQERLRQAREKLAAKKEKERLERLEAELKELEDQL